MQLTIKRPPQAMLYKFFIKPPVPQNIVMKIIFRLKGENRGDALKKANADVIFMDAGVTKSV
jgi:hypothetical protein